MAGVGLSTTPQKVSLRIPPRPCDVSLQMGCVLEWIEKSERVNTTDRPEARYSIFGSGGEALLASEANVPLLPHCPWRMGCGKAETGAFAFCGAQPLIADGTRFMSLAATLSVPTLTPA